MACFMISSDYQPPLAEVATQLSLVLSRRLMRNLCAVVRVSVRAMGDGRHDRSVRSPVAAQLVGDFRHAPAAGALGVLVFGGVGPPRRRGCHDRGPVRIGGPYASRGAQAGGVRPLPPPTTRRCREARASLRGGASHEAEGRRDARAGGADRVGPPTGWYRLRLLRQIGDELVPGVEQFLLVNNVVAVEDGAALVPGQEHGDPFGDIRAEVLPQSTVGVLSLTYLHARVWAVV